MCLIRQPAYKAYKFRVNVARVGFWAEVLVFLDALMALLNRCSSEANGPISTILKNGPQSPILIIKAPTL